ncbi:MAG: metal ABC transporter permease [Actinomycetota bacterium]
MPSLLHDLLFDYTLRTVALGTTAIGIVSGVLGSYALLRKQSLLGDAVSHAALPGVVLAFMITRSRSSIVLLVGALVAGVIAALLISAVVRHSRIKEDSALGIMLSVFFGLGLVLLTMTQRMSDARQAGLDRFLFGQAATLALADVVTMIVIAAAAIALVALLWKEFKLVTFDPQFAVAIGMPVTALQTGLTMLLVVAVVVGLQAVGVILMSALLVAPAAGARQWTDRLGTMAVLAGVFGGVSGVVGVVISSTRSGLSTGPVIVLVVSAITFVSMLIAPNRGLVWNWVGRLRQRQQARADSVLLDLLALSQQHDSITYGHTLDAIEAMNVSRRSDRSTLRGLAERGLATEADDGNWSITPIGVAAAQQLVETNGAGPTDTATDTATDAPDRSANRADVGR